MTREGCRPSFPPLSRALVLYNMDAATTGWMMEMETGGCHHGVFPLYLPNRAVPCLPLYAPHTQPSVAPTSSIVVVVVAARASED